MLFTIAILLSSLSSRPLAIYALPTSNFGPHNNNFSSFLVELQSTTTSGTTPQQVRSTWDIVWSCLATIFACTWVSVHPNSPGLSSGRWTATLRRLELMIWGLLAPEMILLWALRQWVGARKLTELYKDFDGWTTTHAHFLQMGGFVLSSGEEDIEVLSPKQFHTMLVSREICFPNIRKEDIMALGKGDGLSKTIVLCQTIWFIAQCISRAVEGLVITDIELVTCAFCFLNVFMYFFWWDKPLDATFVIRLPKVHWQSDHHHIEFPPWPFAAASAPLSVDSEHSLRPSPRSSFARYRERYDHWSEPDIALPRSPEPVIPNSTNSNDAGNGPNVVTNAESEDVPVIIGAPQNLLPAPTKSRTTSFISDLSWVYHNVAFVWRRLLQMQSAECEERVPGERGIATFGALIGPFNRASNVVLIPHYLAIAVIAIMFGGIHCFAWNFTFTSSVEKIIWRVASSIIVLAPCIVILFTFPLYPYVVRYLNTWRFDQTFNFKGPNFLERGIFNVRGPVIRVVVPIYLLARIILLVEAVIALRDLPQGAYVQVVWSNLIPHI